MQELITSYLVQKKECSLPPVGHFRIKTKPAELDRVNQQLFPPTDEILYSEFTGNLSGDLITYISRLQNITGSEAETKINNWCHQAKEKLDSGGKIIFNSIGSLQKDGAGNISFERKKGSAFYEPVAARRVIHENTEHSVLVGDRETTSVIMNEFYREELVEKKSWWARWNIWAIVLFGISLIILFFYFYSHKFSETEIGNRASFPTKNPPVLHSSP